jgi:predicted ribonuclease YlaK
MSCFPIEVIEEIDRFKRESSELGQNARTVSRMLDAFRGKGSLSDGVKLPNGGKLRITVQKESLTNGNANGKTKGHDHAKATSVDNKILLVAKGIQKSDPKNGTFSSPKTSTFASKPTPSDSTPRTTRRIASTSRISTRA